MDQRTPENIKTDKIIPFGTKPNRETMNISHIQLNKK